MSGSYNGNVSREKMMNSADSTEMIENLTYYIDVQKKYNELLMRQLNQLDERINTRDLKLERLEISLKHLEGKINRILENQAEEKLRKEIQRLQEEDTVTERDKQLLDSLNNSMTMRRTELESKKSWMKRWILK
ncbi:MAG: hypothetical protein ACI35P_16055 [Bacillus sp. (in: firmicutes)]